MKAKFVKTATSGGLFLLISLVVILLNSTDVHAATYDITINSDHSFTPSSLTIDTGDTVRWTVASGIGGFYQPSSDTHLDHFDYPDPSCKNDRPNCWESVILYNGGPTTFSFTFMLAGTWPFHDHQDDDQVAGSPGPSSITVNDTRAPAAVSDLATTGLMGSSVELTWTSPGDDEGNYVNWGTPTSYDVRYSTSPITESSWSSATQANEELTPSVAGSVESLTISGISAFTTYYFAIKTNDELGNESDLSNVLTLEASSAPTGQANDNVPPVKIEDLEIVFVADDSVELSWTAPSDEGQGKAEVYDMRYSRDVITLGNWPFIDKATGEPIPGGSGVMQSMIVSELNHSTTYHFALNSLDSLGNVSPFSNIVSTTTLAMQPAEVSDKEDGGVIDEGTPQEPEEEIVEDDPKAEIEEIKPPAEKQEIIEGDVVQVKEKKEVYVVRGGKRIWIPTPRVFMDLGYDWTSIKQVGDNELSAFPLAQLIRVYEEQEVYELHVDKKRHIPSSSAFLQEGHKWRDIVPVSRSHLNGFSDTQLLKGIGDEKVYIIEGSAKRHIPNATAFQAYGYTWTDVLETRASVVGGYKDEKIVKGVRDFKVFLEVWRKDLQKSIQSSSSLVVMDRGIDIKAYLVGWTSELDGRIASLEDKQSGFYKQVVESIGGGDIEFCLTSRKSQELSLVSLEFCLNTRNYGGGGQSTIFNAIEERLL